MNPKLPNLIIAGVMKGGTTAAAINLAMHPDIFMVNATSKFEDIDFYDLDVSNCKGGLPDPHKELDFFNHKENYKKPKKISIKLCYNNCIYFLNNFGST